MRLKEREVSMGVGNWQLSTCTRNFLLELLGRFIARFELGALSMGQSSRPNAAILGGIVEGWRE
jgi:hypothetical protein